MTQEILSSLKAIEDKLTRVPSSFQWTPEMQAIWPKEYRPTMSGLLAMYAALQGAAQYDAPSRPLPTADAEGWVEWGGGDCPVLEGTNTAVRFRDGREQKDQKPEYWVWRHIDSSGDIIAYRVLP